MSEKKINVVIIDDEHEILSMLESFLNRKKIYKVKTFNNPLSALERLPKETDLILLDVVMPQINGIDLLPKLKKRYPDVKIIIMTASSTLDTVLNAQRYGANNYVMKPFESMDTIVDKIKVIL